MGKAKVGRPRSEEAREAVLTATVELLAEKGKISIEGVARRAEVGKPTIYRWWPSLADIVLEAMLCQADADIPVEEYESLHETLDIFLKLSLRALEKGAGSHLRFLMAEAQRDEGFRERFRENFVLKRRTVLKSVFERAVERGQISGNLDPEILVDIVFGAMWYRLLVGHGALDGTFADELTGVVAALFKQGG